MDASPKPSAREILAVPTNIITGFLGVGKTSAILHLLEQKPATERWAVLVNEFGEIGIDGSLLQGKHSEQAQVFIREVPGGCMCCAAGLPMQIALNQLLSRAKPDRLLIEPTGLGHPKEVLQVLSAEHYHDVLNLEKIITLVDARKLSDERYTNHETFKQQIAIGDTIVGNKLDLYHAEDRSRLEDYVRALGTEHVQLCFAKHGKVSLKELSGATRSIARIESKTHHHHASKSISLASEAPFPESGYVEAINSGEGYRSIGWRFESKKVFVRDKLVQLLQSLEVERMKGVFITDQGVFAYNLADNVLQELELDDSMESRVEFISEDINDGWQAKIMACQMPSASQ